MMKTKTKKVKWLVVGMFVAAVSALSPASYLFYDDFENDEATAWFGATTPHPSVDADPVAQIGSWSINEGVNIWSVQVIDNPANALPGPVSGDNYLALRRPLQGGYVMCTGNLTEASSDAALEIGFNAFIPAGDDYVNSQMYFFLSGGTAASPVQALQFQLLKTGSILLNNNVWVGGSGAFTPNAWVNFKIHDFDFDANTFSMSFGTVGSGSTTTVDNLAFSGSVNDVFRLQLHQAAGGLAFVDDVYAMVVPEPTTLLLLGAGATMLLRKRK